MHGSPKENDLQACEAVPWGETGLLSSVGFLLGSRAGGKAAKQEGGKTGLCLYFWLLTIRFLLEGSIE